jgi:hypothetical protein
MMLLIENKTNVSHQICLFDGTSITLGPKGETKISNHVLFPEELIRIQKFLHVTWLHNKQERQRTVRATKRENNNNGGTL